MSYNRVIVNTKERQMFTWTEKDARRSRAYTCKLIEMAEEGLIDWESLARDALNWMSEHEVSEFARRNDYIRDEEDDDRG